MATRKKNARPQNHWFLYILQCNDGTLYTGITNDLSRRLAQHNGGNGSRYTRGRRPVTLIYQEPCRGRSDALKKEHAVKQLSKKDKGKYINLKRAFHYRGHRDRREETRT